MSFKGFPKDTVPGPLSYGIYVELPDHVMCASEVGDTWELERLSLILKNSFREVSLTYRVFSTTKGGLPLVPCTFPFDGKPDILT